MGLESQGMLLAGDDGEQVGVLTARDAAPGTAVRAGTLENGTAQLTYDDFMKLTITVQDGKPVVDGLSLRAGDEDVIADKKLKDGARVR